MAGPDRIDIVALHGQDVLQQLGFRNRAASLGAEFMAVDALEHDPLTVQKHQAVFDLKAAAANLLGYILDHLARCVA